ncbi:hypothetical protein Y032_0750g2046 [Ancylostoma ceylanicum]|uniref:Uncharacterized protein n=1 Tax=Ancylostoma ceylanicum TaxID=53326 RepID=A0A016WFG5_9BILA|nr:hypothetical protein Y032_0750g2046 [Ancylostoma ceylanicum]
MDIQQQLTISNGKLPHCPLSEKVCAVSRRELPTCSQQMCIAGAPNFSRLGDAPSWEKWGEHYQLGGGMHTALVLGHSGTFLSPHSTSLLTMTTVIGTSRQDCAGQRKCSKTNS